MTNNDAPEMKAAIERNVNGRGGYVYAQNTDTAWLRVIDAKINRGTVMAKSLNSGKWFRIIAWEVR